MHSRFFYPHLNVFYKIRLAGLAISKRRVVKKLVSGVLFSGDWRGKHTTRPNKICESVKNVVEWTTMDLTGLQSMATARCLQHQAYHRRGLSAPGQLPVPVVSPTRYSSYS